MKHYSLKVFCIFRDSNIITLVMDVTLEEAEIKIILHASRSVCSGATKVDLIIY